MSDSTYDVTSKQVGTNELSASARLDRTTEEALYWLFRSFFKTAEEDRRWSVWNSVNWDAVMTNPPANLIDAVLASYREDLFLPDYSARALHLLRASRGRAWFLTRWSYEEGKHMLTLNEWLLRSGSFTDSELRELTEAHLQAYRWEPLYQDGTALLTDMLLWELREIERYQSLRALAETVGDPALTEALGFVIIDEEAHRDFFRAALAIIAKTYPERVTDAVHRVAEAQEFPGGESGLQILLTVGSV